MIFNKNYSRFVDKDSPYLLDLSNYKFGILILFFNIKFSFLFYFLKKIQIDLINIYIQTYLDIVKSDLLIKHQQSIEDLKNNGDEEVVVQKEKNCNIYLVIIFNFS